MRYECCPWRTCMHIQALRAFHNSSTPKYGLSELLGSISLPVVVSTNTGLVTYNAQRVQQLARMNVDRVHEQPTICWVFGDFREHKHPSRGTQYILTLELVCVAVIGDNGLPLACLEVPAPRHVLGCCCLVAVTAAVEALRGCCGWAGQRWTLQTGRPADTT